MRWCDTLHLAYGPTMVPPMRLPMFDTCRHLLLLPRLRPLPDDLPHRLTEEEGFPTLLASPMNTLLHTLKTHATEIRHAMALLDSSL